MSVARLGLALLVVALAAVGVECAMFYQGDNTPVIGVYTQPSHFYEYDWQYDYIVGSNLNWLQQHGARVVPVSYAASEAELREVFAQINGLLFTGGGLDLHYDQPIAGSNQTSNVFVRNAQFLMNLAKEANDNGVYFPVWGNCQGFELMLILENNLQHDVLQPIDAQINVSRAAQSIDATAAMFAGVDADLLAYAQENDGWLYYHEWAVYPEVFAALPVAQFYSVTA